MQHFIITITFAALLICGCNSATTPSLTAVPDVDVSKIKATAGDVKALKSTPLPKNVVIDSAGHHTTAPRAK